MYTSISVIFTLRMNEKMKSKKAHEEMTER